MAGAIIMTGANSSMAIPAVDHLLGNYPEFTAVLTVRDPSDANSKKLEATIARHAGAKASIRKLDLADLAAVRAFSDDISTEIADGKLPSVSSVICNAFFWDLVNDPAKTIDGLEKTLQVNHVAHALIVLRLLDKFTTNGRVVFLSSDAMTSGKLALERLPPTLPDDVNELASAEPADDKQAHGFLRYARSKMASVAFMYSLNRKLEKDPKRSGITAVAINPGNLPDSRALQTNTPFLVGIMQRFVLQPFYPLLRRVDPSLRPSAAAAVDVIDMATGKEHPGERGHFTFLEKTEGPPETLDQAIQEKIWNKSLEWAGITREDTALGVSFE